VNTILFSVGRFKLGVALAALLVGLKLDGAITYTWTVTLSILWLPPMVSFTIGFIHGFFSKAGYDE
jgi:hypothetical protein